MVFLLQVWPKSESEVTTGGHGKAEKLSSKETRTNLDRIFFVEGAVTTLYGIVCLFFMPHTPSHAKFLTDEEKKITMARLKDDSHGATEEEDVKNEKFDWHWVKMAFTSPNLWMTSLAWYVVTCLTASSDLSDRR